MKLTTESVAAIVAMAGVIGGMIKLGHYLIKRLLDALLSNVKAQQAFVEKYGDSQVKALEEVKDTLVAVQAQQTAQAAQMETLCKQQQDHDTLNAQHHMQGTAAMARLAEILASMNGKKPKPQEGTEAQ